MRAASLALALIATPVGAQTVHAIRPSAADPAVRAFDEPSLAVAPAGVAADAPLVVLMSGTGGRPQGLATLMRVVAAQGYRVIALGYDDEPAVVQICNRDPDPDCSAKFRERRLSGTGPGVAGVDNPPAEGIAARLAAALRALAAQAPAEGWGQYLESGVPAAAPAGSGIRWDRLVVGGLSQGAGMAAFIAKHHAVRRVVLFSSPWDFTGPNRHPAPWLAAPSATPIDRWFAAYNARERTVPLIRAAYARLGLAADHVRVFDLDLPTGFVTGANPNPYHPIGIHDPRYAPQWRTMFGRADDPMP